MANFWFDLSLLLSDSVVLVKALDSRSRIPFPAAALPGSDPGQVVHTHIACCSMVWYGIVEFNVPLDTI